MFNWLFERNAFTVGRIAIPPEDSLAEDSGINAMIEIYDQTTAFTWSDAVQRKVSRRGHYANSYYVIPSWQIQRLIPLY
jgi:hypothetical protein